jgi:aryl-alcohol dehydrogenase-like predicted oxidoreductase
VEKRRLGGSDQELSALGFGAWVTGADTFTAAVDEHALTRAVRAALDVGVNWIDTAELYARGTSEEIVGRATAAAGRDVFLSTKVAPHGAGTGTHPREIALAIRASLGRLRRDHVDLYQLHWYDPTVPVEESWGAMSRLVDEGLARFIGVCNFDRQMVERCLTVGPVHSVQNQLSLLHRADVMACQDGSSFVGWLAKRGIGYLAYGSLAFGLLSAALSESTFFDRSDWRSGRARWEANYYEELFAPGRFETHVAFARELALVAGDVGLPAPVLALRWTLEQPGVTALIMGSRSPEHIRVNSLAGEIRLGPAAQARLDDLLIRYESGGRVGEDAAT